MNYWDGKLRHTAFINSDLCLTLGLHRRFKLRSSFGSDKSGTCQAKTLCYSSLQPSKKRPQQRNAQFREDALHHFRVFSALLQLAAQARQCLLVPPLICTSWHTGKRWPKSDKKHDPLFILFSILCFLNPQPSHRSGSIHHNLARSLLASFPFPISALSINSSGTTEPCTTSEELAQGSPCQGHCHSADDWIRGFGTALFITVNEAEPNMQFLGVFCLTPLFPFWSLDQSLNSTSSHLKQLLQRFWGQDWWGHSSALLFSDTDVLLGARLNRRLGLGMLHSQEFSQGKIRKYGLLGDWGFKESIGPFFKLRLWLVTLHI